MPYIQISNAYGYVRQISSSDNETVARWLVETLSLFASPNSAYGDIRIRVDPLTVGFRPNAAWDWHPGANQQFAAELKELTPIGNVRALAALMLEYADRAEKGRG